MDYTTFRQTAVKWDVSERRIQKMAKIAALMELCASDPYEYTKGRREACRRPKKRQEESACE